MNPIAEEINSYLGSAEMSKEEFLEHYGRGHLDGGHSGRYPYGSGDDAYQRAVDFLTRVDQLKKSGWKATPENIKKEFGLTTSQYHKEISICNDDRRMALISRAVQLRDNSQLGATEIGRRLGVRESTVREWFKQEQKSRYLQTRETAAALKKRLDELPREKKMIDVGKGVEKDLNISRTKLDTALYLLQRDGYHVYGGRIPQHNDKNKSVTLTVLASPEVAHREMFDHPEYITTLNDYISRDGGKTLEKKFNPPASMDSKRIKVRYADEVDSDGFTGKEKDGTIEIRRGVPDLDLKGSRYAQVRILVDGTHYMKGMAIYSDNMPDGYDVVFNTNKSKNTPLKSDNKDMPQVLKNIKKDPDNPFGSNIKDANQGGQYWYKDPKTGEKKLGLINKRADEGDWTDWQDALPSQFLSKQSKQMITKQLNIAKADKLAEFDTYCKLENPTVKKYYLNKFADKCDAAAVDLKAAALPGQKYHVIMPFNGMGDNKIYAPKYADGTKLALVRYPHAGIFEIPILTVDNKHKLARKLLGTDADDAVGISYNVAAQLSGADFDGDTVMCIPTHDRQGKVRVLSSKRLKDLIGFDHQLEYGPDPDKAPVVDKNGDKYYFRGDRKYKAMTNQIKQKEMGVVSNLITDMTLQNAPEDKLARAVKHSMVVIDAEKHKLDYKKSYIDNRIKELQLEYQPKIDKNGKVYDGGGAYTIVSKSGGQHRILKVKGAPRVNIPGKPWYDPSRPEGSLLKMTAPDNEVYFPDATYDKKTGVKTIITTKGKKISFDTNDPEARDKYDVAKEKDPKTGKLNPILKVDAKGRYYTTNKDGTIEYRTRTRHTDSTNMAETDDAYTLVSKTRHPTEILYADYANSMKALANRARIEMFNTPNLEYNRTANKVYAKEVASLNAKLNNALKNKPKERTAIRMANAEIRDKVEADPEMTKGDIKKVYQRSLNKHRDEVGAISRRDRSIDITDKEWEAIQAGAISNQKLKDILDNSDPDILRERAMPKERKTLNVAQVNRIKAMSGTFTIAQIADKMNISPSTVSKYLKGGK